ncbi:HNH endonuclease [Umezawaea tangerina]|uniref:HNH endonuclease n=1 Tax=Umezawaea tangerina TaxID=84725 RepID=A0A2T0SPJ7_9PSEU|nr:HNH endonuclease [Umezawaea tangerina]PRY35283.1 hypothetical protein CLV43_114201 [Umezawaea tangerina]
MNVTLARKLVRERSAGLCEVKSPWCEGRATNWSHRLAQGQGGLWAPSNGLDVCGMGNATGCHGYLHQHPTRAEAEGWLVPPGQTDPIDVPTRIHTITLGHALVFLDDDGCLSTVRGAA